MLSKTLSKFGIKISETKNQLPRDNAMPDPVKPKSFKETVRCFLLPQVRVMFFLGFSSGIPLLLIFSSLSIWLREAQVERATVTFFSWAALGYSFKFVWAPLIDYLPIPIISKILGKRRSWLLLAQLCISGSLVFMAMNDPQQNLILTAIGAVLLGFSGATQDIVIDAYRIESANVEYQSIMSSVYIAGYRIGMILAGAGTLKLAAIFSNHQEDYHFIAWSYAYLCMAASMTIGIVTTLLISEPKSNSKQSTKSVSDYLRFLLLFVLSLATFLTVFFSTADMSQQLKSYIAVNTNHIFLNFLVEFLRFLFCIGATILAVMLQIKFNIAPKSMVKDVYIAPFNDFFARYGRIALLIIAFISVYRISDIVMGAVANVFYADTGYTKDQIALVTKTFGIIMTILGGFLGGLSAVRYGVMRTLWIGALLTALTNMLFAILAISPPKTYLLMVIIAADNLSGGLAGTAFVAFLSGLTSRKFTAVQYAVFSSLMTLFPKILAGYSGTIVDNVGYEIFFIASGLIGIPVVWLVSKVAKMNVLPASP